MLSPRSYDPDSEIWSVVRVSSGNRAVPGLWLSFAAACGLMAALLANDPSRASGAAAPSPRFRNPPAPIYQRARQQEAAIMNRREFLQLSAAASSLSVAAVAADRSVRVLNQ